MADIPFLKKIVPPSFSLDFLRGKPKSVLGIDIGTYSTKIIQIRNESERAILETYGELKNAGYFKLTEGSYGGFLRYLDTDIASILKDILRESNTTTDVAVMSVPASASFVTTLNFPKIAPKELAEAIPFEARKYVPIPISEVILDWDILEMDNEKNEQRVALVAVPKEVAEKFKRVSRLAGIKLEALEVEIFGMIRSLVGRDPLPTAIINLGHQATTLTIADKGKLRLAHSFSRGSQELTKALEHGLQVNQERAETMKREIGLSEKIEEREITSIIAPFLETLFSEIERLISMYNRKAERKIQKINLTGGGANLYGIVEFAASKYGTEVVRGNPFSRVVTPAFLQPVLRSIGPTFSVATGLALRQVTAS